MLEERSATEQAATIRNSLSGLSDADPALLDQGQRYVAANSLIASWKAGAGTIGAKAGELRQLAESQRGALQPAPDEPAAARDPLDQARAEYAALLQDAVAALNQVANAARRIVDEEYADGPWTCWNALHEAFRSDYDAATQRSSSRAEKLQQLRALETKIAGLADETTRIREALATMATADANYVAARKEWIGAQAEHDNLVDWRVR